MRPRAPQVGDTSEHLPTIMAGARLPCVVVACVMPGVRVFDYPTTIRFSYHSSVLLIEVYGIPFFGENGFLVTGR